MGEVARIWRLSGWSRSVFLCSVPDPPSTCTTPGKIRPIIQSRELAGHVWLCNSGGTDQPLEAPVLKRSAAFLPCLFLQPGSHVVFFPRRPFIPRLIDMRYYPDRCVGVLRSVIFSRGNSNFAVRLASSIARSRKSTTHIIYCSSLPSTHHQVIIATKYRIGFTTTPLMNQSSHENNPSTCAP